MVEGVDGAARPLDRNAIIIFAVPMAVTTILAWIGDAFAPTLLVSAPLVLILCNPRLRNLVLAAPTLAAAPFIAVSVFRLVLTDPFFYWFGRRYGDASIRWMEAKLGSGATVVLRGRDGSCCARSTRRLRLRPHESTPGGRAVEVDLARLTGRRLTGFLGHATRAAKPSWKFGSPWSTVAATRSRPGSCIDSMPSSSIATCSATGSAAVK